jgi:hypothetical protein
MRAMAPRYLVVCAGALVAACSSDGPTSTSPRADKASNNPKFLSPASGAPTIANPIVSFYAKKGEKRTGVMMYHARPGAKDSTAFLRFEVEEKSLTLAQSDSVLITMTLVDPANLVVDFQPAGLQFNPSEPAELELSYLETNPDVNGDGIVDQQDSLLIAQLQVWRQETSSDPWLPISSNDLLDDELEAPITGFTRYAIAY